MAQVRQTGPNSWLCRVRLRGHAPVSRTFKTETEARKFGRGTEKALRQGRKAQDAPPTGPTVGDAVDAFRALRDAGKRPVNPRSNEEFMLRHLAADARRGELGAVPVAALTAARLIAFCRLRAEDGAGPYTISMEVSKLRTVLKYSQIALHETWGDPVGAALPTLEYASLVGPGTRRDRRVSADELERLLMEELDATMSDIVMFAIATAMRRGEICRIAWKDVDTQRRLVLVRDRKHPRKKVGNNVWVPLTAFTGFDAWAILQRQPRVDGEARIFPVEPEYVSDTFLAACKRAEISDLHFHDLRHEATSRFFEAGLSIERVALLTGHADWRNLRRYTHLRPESLTAQSPVLSSISP